MSENTPSEIETEFIKILTESSVLDNQMSTSSDTSSLYSLSSDDEWCERKQQQRILFFVEKTIPGYSNEIFKSHFRMSRTTAYKLIETIEQSGLIPCHADGREKISAEKAFLLTVWYLSNTETYRQISDRFNVTYSSAHRCIRRVLKYIVSLKHVVIEWPSGDRALRINNGFEGRAGVKNVLGAIDGSHIEIIKPGENQDSYINRKGYHSLILQGVVDHQKKFTDVFCGEPGFMHDARVFRKSNLYRKMFREPNLMGDNFLIGDSAYPNLQWLVSPFRDNGALSQMQKSFNSKLAATRVVVEIAFGLLKGRFRRLRKLDNLDLNICAEIILASCILHNICIDYDDMIEVEEHDINQPELIPWQAENLDVDRLVSVFHRTMGVP